MKLYGYKNGRTLRALWTLEEIGAQYEYIEVDLFGGEGRTPWFLGINPAGKVPVLDDAGFIITESAAICMHLADKHPDCHLMPPIGTPERTDCYKWISFILTELDAHLWTIAKHRFALPEKRRVPAVIETASWEFLSAAQVLANALADKPFIVGSSLTVADILAGHTLLWARGARLPLKAAFLEGYLEDLIQRDALRRARTIAKSRPNTFGAND